jgi:FG-GAP-like repeat
MNISRAHLFVVFACCLLSGHGFAVDVLTYHNDNARTGLNSQEATLTPLNVNSNSFGLIRNLPVDGAVFAQPLYVSNAEVSSGGQSKGSHNLLIVATEHDSVFAFDADSGTLYWQVSLLGTGEVPSDGLGCSDLPTENGVTSTPVIDRAMGPNGTIYVLAMSKTPNNANYYERLHALDLSTGQPFLAPVTIQASYPGKGPPNDGQGNVLFGPTHQRGRAGLLLTNGTIYTSWGSFCDFAPFTGWIIAYNEQTLAQTRVFNTDPNGTPKSSDLPDGSGSGVWQAGQPPAVDSAGNLYVSTGNGPFDTNLDSNGFPVSKDYGDSLLKLTPGLQVTNYFTPTDQLSLAENDGDFGSGGPLVVDISDSDNTIHHLVISAGKDSNIYVVDRDTMGGFSSPINNIYQVVTSVLSGGVWSSPAYFNGSIYYDSQGHSLLQFKFNSKATLDPEPASASSATFPFPGGTPSISSLGNTNGIVWIKELRNGLVILHAYDATNLANELYSSAGVNFGAPTKFGPPTVCNGKVFVGTMTSVGVFGFLPPPSQKPTAKDFNGDGYADLILENTANGARLIWLLKNGAYNASIALHTASPDWHISAVGDFLGNGQSDLVMENTVTGEHVIWIIKDGALQNGIELPSASTGWHVVGAGDFNGDGFADLVWENSNTGGRVIWLLNKGVYSSSISLPTLSPSWHIAGVGDFLGNGQSDLVLENTISGHLDIWILTNGVFQNGIGLPNVSTGWQIAGAADFNGDGQADLVLQNSLNGDPVIWVLNKGVYSYSIALPSLSAHWNIVNH